MCLVILIHATLMFYIKLLYLIMVESSFTLCQTLYLILYIC